MRVDYDKDQLAYALANAIKERDEAREDAQKSKAYKRVLKETNLRQTERIRYLEGATNHASGTPLSRALKERDETRENLDQEMKFHHRTHAELVQTQCKLLDIKMKYDQFTG